MGRYRFSDQEYQTLFHYAVALTGCRQSGFDLLHELMLNWEESQPKSIDNPMAYLKRSIRNLYFDQIKLNRRRHELLETNTIHHDMNSAEQALEQMVIDSVTLERIWQQLTPQEREVIYLWAIEGYTAREIGLQLKTPRSSILSMMHRMRRRILNHEQERKQP